MKNPIFAFAAVTAIVMAPSFAIAGKPDSPGVFGKDRARNIHVMQNGGAPGASEWGHLAASRGGTNGDMNRSYKSSEGGDPNPDNDNGGGND